MRPAVSDAQHLTAEQRAGQRTAGHSCRSMGGGGRLSSGKNAEGSGTAATDHVTAKNNQGETMSEDHARLSH